MLGVERIVSNELNANPQENSSSSSNAGERPKVRANKWPFVNVAAGEVHPQPHIILFGKEKKMLFTSRTHYKLK